jgi:hypothetical protein
MYREVFEFHVFARGHPESRTANLGSEYRIVLSLRNAPLFPLIREVLSDSDTPKPFVYPIGRVSFLFVERFHPFLGQFGIFNLFDPFVTDFCQPFLEWLGFWGWNGLYDTQDSFGVRAIRCIFFSIGTFEFQLSTNCR